MPGFLFAGAAAQPLLNFIDSTNVARIFTRRQGSSPILGVNHTDHFTLKHIPITHLFLPRNFARRKLNG